MNSIFAKNEELENRFLKNYKPGGGEQLRGNTENGILALDGVLCWFNIFITEYAPDTEENRKAAVKEWEDLERSCTETEGE